jgi:hypothetical protein
MLSDKTIKLKVITNNIFCCFSVYYFNMSSICSSSYIETPQKKSAAFTLVGICYFFVEHRMESDSYWLYVASLFVKRLYLNGRQLISYADN